MSTPMKDAVATMGGVLPDDVQGRDAVHVAVFSAVSGEKMLPGQDVAILPVKAQHAPAHDTLVSSFGDAIGIVDPFIKSAVPPGERFWVFLYPRTITSLAHRWSHPAFAAVADESAPAYTTPASKLASEQWLRDFCDNNDCPGYDTVMEAARKVANDDSDAYNEDYLHFDGQDAHGEIPDEFWVHVEVVLGRPIKGTRAKYFSCSC